MLLEDNLRADRIATYNAIMEPFIILLTPPGAWKLDSNTFEQDKNDLFISKLTSLSSRQSAFQLALVANDAVVRAYSNLVQLLWQCSEKSPLLPADIRHLHSLLGQFLLEVRKSMGNEDTKLKNQEIIE